MTTTAGETETRLMDAAETLFGVHGVDAVSVRDITTAAGANVAAVNYHFGSKEGLVRAVWERTMLPLNEERVRRLETAQPTETGAPELEEILRAFLAPAMELMDGRPAFLRFVARLHAEPTAISGELLAAARLPELVAAYRAALIRALPDVPIHSLWWRIQFVIGAMLHAFTKCEEMETLSGGECRRGTAEELTGELVRFCAAGLRTDAGGSKR